MSRFQTRRTSQTAKQQCLALDPGCKAERFNGEWIVFDGNNKIIGRASRIERDSHAASHAWMDACYTLKNRFS